MKDSFKLRRKLIDLIRQKKSNTEICEALNINYDDLYYLLLASRNDGIIMSSKYYSDGSIRHKIANNFGTFRESKTLTQDRTIITDPCEQTVRFLGISDLHFGNEEERIDLVEDAFNYCVRNGIHIILGGGDFIDGKYTRGRQIIPDLYEQVYHFLTYYPHDDSIITFGVGGDHDLSALTNGVSLMEACNSHRPDVVIGGYNNCLVNIKNDQILLFHHVDRGSIRKVNAPFIVHGHSHKYSTYMNGTSLNVTLPSLSGINEGMPSVVDITISFKNGYMSVVNIKHVFFVNNKDIVLGESFYDISTDRSLVANDVNNEETFLSDSILPEIRRALFDFATPPVEKPALEEVVEEPTEEEIVEETVAEETPVEAETTEAVEETEVTVVYEESIPADEGDIFVVRSSAAEAKPMGLTLNKPMSQIDKFRRRYGGASPQ